MTTKTCRTCKTEKPLSEFQSRGKWGPDAHCKPCRHAKDNARYEKTLTIEAKMRREWRKTTSPGQRQARYRETQEAKRRAEFTAERRAYLDYLKALSPEDRASLSGQVSRHGVFSVERWLKLQGRRNETPEQSAAREVLEKSMAWQELRGRKRGFVAELKRAPCKDCEGTYPPECMDFDHLGDKLDNVSRIVQGGSMGKLKREVAKCDLVCANCHRVRTSNRRRGLPAVLPPPEYFI